MKRALLFVVLAVSICACSRETPPPPVWDAVSVNSTLLPSTNVGSVTAVINDVACSTTNPSAYSVEVEWTSSVSHAQRGILEYRISSSEADASAETFNKVASTFDIEESSGELTFEIMSNEVRDAGDTLYVRLKIQTEDGVVVMSPSVEYTIAELCVVETVE